MGGGGLITCSAHPICAMWSDAWRRGFRGRRSLRRLAYQVAKAAAALLPAFEGEKLDRVILTGGMARSELLVERLTHYLAGLPCGVTVYAGENELVALAKGALRVLYGKETAKEYPAPVPG
jgi:butyrate kinase